LGSQRFKAFLAQVTEAYDHVILDCCPLLSVGDTLELIPQVDGIVLCVRASRTTRHQAQAAKSALAAFPARPTGVVVTGLRHGDESDYGYYSYAYGATSA
jgi:Mrp family chromosome partitioning ATPase